LAIRTAWWREIDNGLKQDFIKTAIVQYRAMVDGNDSIRGIVGNLFSVNY
jgi:hypothetical protein